jgi:hypothetical protein
VTQNDLYEWLITERMNGNHDFFSIAKVYRKMLDLKNADMETKTNLARSIRKLQKYGYLETQGITIRGVVVHSSYFRIKEKYYIKEVKKRSKEHLLRIGMVSDEYS